MNQHTDLDDPINPDYNDVNPAYEGKPQSE